MRRLRIVLPLVMVVVAACAEPTPTPTPAPETPTPGPETPTPTPAATPQPTPTPDETPDAALPPFDCDALPYEDEGEVALTNIADVRVGSHEDYDRIVFEFQAYDDVDATREAGVPEHFLRVADRLVEHPRGVEMEVEGNAFLHLTLLGGTRLTAEFDETYEGPLEFEVDSPQLRHLVEAGDFEATADWYIGLAEADPCLRVMVFDEPSRLVIDIEHP